MNGDDSEKKEESHDATIDVLRKDEQDLAVIQASKRCHRPLNC
jgi:hypothetical protein